MLRDACYQVLVPNVPLPLIMRLHRTILGLQREIRHAMTALDRRQHKPHPEAAGDGEDSAVTHSAPDFPAAAETSQPAIETVPADATASGPAREPAAAEENGTRRAGSQAPGTTAASMGRPAHGRTAEPASGLFCDSPLGTAETGRVIHQGHGGERWAPNTRPGRPLPVVARDTASPAGQMEDIRAAA